MPDLQHLKRQAKDLLKAHRAADPAVTAHLRRHLPRLAGSPGQDAASVCIALRDAQHAVAREFGFANWADCVQRWPPAPRRQRRPCPPSSTRS